MAGSIYVPSGLTQEGAALPGLSSRRKAAPEPPVDGTLLGGAGDDQLIGGALRDSLFGGEGRDYLDGGAGDDLLAGGAGNDTYFLTDARDQILEAAGEGEDWVWLRFERLPSYQRQDLLYRLPDNVEHALVAGDLDYLHGNALGNTLDITKASGRVEIRAYEGDDVVLVDGAARAVLYAGEGDDRAYGGRLADVLLGGGGRDQLHGGAGDDFLQGEAGDDRLFGGAGADNLEGGAGDNSLYGGSGWDRLLLAQGKNLGEAGSGRDDIVMGGGEATAYGGQGDDFFFGDGADPGGRLLAYGGSGNDQLGFAGGHTEITFHGGSGRDVLGGASGNDLLYGGAGADYLGSSTGIDSLHGGAGADMVVLRQEKGDADHWVDFSMADGDFIDIYHVTGAGAVKSDPIREGFARLVDVRLEDGTEAVAVEIDSDGGGDDFHRLLYLHDQKAADLRDYALFHFDYFPDQPG